MNINAYAKFDQNIPNGLKVIDIFRHFFTNRPASKSLFQNLNLSNASVNPKWHLTISWATSCQYQCVCKILSKYSKRFKSYCHFFTNRPASKSSQTVSAMPRPIPNHIDPVNINVYTKVYQTIPLSSRDRAIFTFLEFEPRQRSANPR